MRKRKSAKSTNTATSRGEGFKIKSQAAVNMILAKQQSAKSMQLTGGASDELRESRRARETEFLKRVRKAAKEERANRLRWSVLLHVHARTCTCTCMYVYMYMYMHAHVHVHVCMYMHAHS